MARQSVPAALPLMRAALKARCGYNVLLGAVLRGELEGWQDDSRRWYVSATDLERWIAHRQRQRAARETAAVRA